MSRTGRSRSNEPLPPPLPPETRTVGQLVAESLRFYRRRFWPSLATGLPPAILAVAGAELTRRQQLAFVSGAGAVLLTASYVGACVLVAERPVERRRLLVALAAGVLAFVPVPLLAIVFVLPAVAWLALVGLAVPVAVLEGTGLRASFARAIVLARADFVHALGSLATLTIAVFLSQAALFFVLRGAGDATVRIAAFLADLVISPLLFLGSALLYFDQAARAPARVARDARGPASRIPDL